MKSVDVYKIVFLFTFISLINCSSDDDSSNSITNPTALFECIDGMAGPYPCNNFDLMSNISAAELGGTGAEGNDSWGWTDPMTDNEYALVGLTTVS